MADTVFVIESSFLFPFKIQKWSIVAFIMAIKVKQKYLNLKTKHLSTWDNHWAVSCDICVHCITVVTDFDKKL